MKFFILLISLFFTRQLQAHEYFFAFAEVNYNATEKVFEITLEGSAHDVEDVLNETGIAIRELEDHYKDSTMLSKLEKFICAGLKIKTGRELKLHLQGYEVDTKGLVYFYLKSEPDENFRSVTFTFDWLMDALPQQQNKITLSIHSRKYTCVFLSAKRTETVELI